MKSTFVYTRIPDTAQYKWGDWSGHRGRITASTLEQARAWAEKDPTVSYFFHTRRPFTLERVGPRDRYFAAGDGDFFAGGALWLGHARGMADTHMVAEVFDTSDTDTRDALLRQLRKGLLLDDRVDTSTGTTATPRVVKVGLVFCDFADVKGGDQAELRNLLLGPTTNGKSAFEDFFARESGGRVSMAVETYDKGWVTLPKGVAEYKDKYDDLASAVDSRIEFPDSWDIVLFAFPRTGYVNRSNFWVGHSQCKNGMTVDGAQGVSYNFLDPSHYDSSGPPAHVTTIHEALHSLGLTDLYDSALNRSYGWSVMSAAGAGRHITEFEKLLLGWRDPAEFTFLRRGLVEADSLLTGRRRGIVVLPDAAAGRPDVVFVEPAQEVGIGAVNEAAYLAQRGPDRGLLVMVARQDGRYGRISPYVHARPEKPLVDRERFGGASRAPFPAVARWSVNGVISYPVFAFPAADGTRITRVIGVDGGFRTPDRASVLRENDQIATTTTTGRTVRFQLSIAGLLGFDGTPILIDGAGELLPSSIDDLRLPNADYGFCAYVDRQGNLNLAASQDDTPATPAAVLRTWRPPPGVAFGGGACLLRIEERAGTVFVTVHERLPDGRTQWRHDLFREPDVVRRGRQWQDGEYTIEFDEGAGNLKVVRSGQFVTGSYQQFDETSIGAIRFAEDGRMTWVDDYGKVLRTFSGRSGTGPFTFAVDRRDATRRALVVRDVSGATLYDVYPFTA